MYVVLLGIPSRVYKWLSSYDIACGIIEYFTKLLVGLRAQHIEENNKCILREWTLLTWGVTLAISSVSSNTIYLPVIGNVFFNLRRLSEIPNLMTSSVNWQRPMQILLFTFSIVLNALVCYWFNIFEIEIRLLKKCAVNWNATGRVKYTITLTC